LSGNSHFGDVPTSQSLGLELKKLNQPEQKQMSISNTKILYA